MKFYFAGNGRKPEDIEEIRDYKTDVWNVLVSYKDHKTKKGEGSKRFKLLMDRKSATTEFDSKKNTHPVSKKL